ncbi:NF038122 family metalloprotease, partial [candidate division WOR-3 bacterium]|nr:NF038122 family metalloprotease [candidate division WOR-3 bacterium]
MKDNRRLTALTLICVVACFLPDFAAAQQNRYLERDYYFREPGPVMKSQLYLDGSTVEFETGSIIYPVVGSDLSQITPEEFRELALMNSAAAENATNKVVVSPDRAGRGLNIVYNCVNVPQPAMAALESVAVYIEQLFDDNVTVSINISFASLPAGVLGQAQSYIAGNPSWSITRSSLVADMDGDDSIQLWLPTTSTIPVRYTYGSSAVTNEDRVYFLVAPYNAVIGVFSSLAASITFSTNFTWDYEPWNGVSGYCFQSVVAHEIGHVLGFVSNADGSGNDIFVLDIYRFQHSDGGMGYNPSTWYEFQTTARMVDLSPGNDDVNSDMIAVEYRMSDGSPYQASHFSQGNVNAIMQPAFSSGQTYYPYFYRSPDRAMFDAIGWDHLTSYYLMLGVWGSGGSVVANPALPSYPPDTSVEITAVPDAGWEFVEWGGDLISSNNPDTIIMNSDKSISASFQTINCTLTVNVVGNGIVLKDPDLPYYPRGSSVILTAVPDPGWTFSFWSGNLWGSTNPATLIMNGDRIVTANFTYTGVEENKLGLIAGNHFSITPNPASGIVSIRYQTADPSRVDLVIYDASGQLVRSFHAESSIPNQESVIAWHGEDNGGRKLPGGVYFVKFEAGDYQETVK